MSAHYIGDTVSLDPVPAIVRETRESGWPHQFTSKELHGLGRATARVLFPGSPKRGHSCTSSPSTTTCTAWKPSGYTVAVRFRGCGAIRRQYRDRGPCGIWEDGSARGYVVAILLPPVTYNPSGKD